MEAKDKIEASEKTKKLGLPAAWEEGYEMMEFAGIDSPVAELSSCISTNHGTDVVFVRLSGENAESNLAFLKLQKISGKAHDFSRGMKAPQCFFLILDISDYGISRNASDRLAERCRIFSLTLQQRYNKR